jgi:hypothetical protein
LLGDKLVASPSLSESSMTGLFFCGDSKELEATLGVGNIGGGAGALIEGAGAGGAAGAVGAGGAGAEEAAGTGGAGADATAGAAVVGGDEDTAGGDSAAAELGLLLGEAAVGAADRPSSIATPASCELTLKL